MATFEVDVDVHDILYELSDREKREMYEDLKEELEEDGVSKNPEDLFNSGTSYMEQEIGKALAWMWEYRNMLTTSQRNRILAITKENFVEQ
jgi:hypothetical protein